MGTVLIVTGVLTAAAGIGLVAPRTVLRVVFGTATDNPTIVLVVRHWYLLVALVGGLLIYAGNHEPVRMLVMIVATVEKVVLAALVVASPLRKRLVTVAVIGADIVMAALYVTFLLRSIA